MKHITYWVATTTAAAANKLKKVSVIASGSLLLAFSIGGAAQAARISLNFDELTPQAELANQYSSLGVTFSNSHGPLRVQRDYPGSPFTSSNAILPDNFFETGNYTQANFSTIVNSVSVTLGDFGEDIDNLYLELYDLNNTLIGSDFYLLPASVSGGYTLSASSANIAYARFYGRGLNNKNNVFFDNFSYNVVDNVTSVPGSSTTVDVFPKVDVNNVPYNVVGNPTSVSEPSTIFSLFAFGVLAGSSLLKPNKSKKGTGLIGRLH
jgi:hypothetical protein